MRLPCLVWSMVSQYIQAQQMEVQLCAKLDFVQNVDKL